MVIWVFSGGGPAEARGLIPFLQKQFPQHVFQRKMPVGFKRNPLKPPTLNKGNPEKYQARQRTSGSGATGKSLAEQVRKRLSDSLKYGEPCDLILIFDDLDCRDANVQIEQFNAIIDSVGAPKQIKRIIGFAAPELESWIIADWDHVISQYAKFKSSRIQMKLWLRDGAHVPFDIPEEFSLYDSAKDSCQEKLSKAIQDCANIVAQEYYSKDTDTSNLIKLLNSTIVMQKCPLFRKLYHELSDLT